MAKKAKSKTKKSKKKARKDGQVPRTPELGGWSGLLIATIAMGPLLDRELGALREMMVVHLKAAENPSLPLALDLLVDGARHVLFTLVID